MSTVSFTVRNLPKPLHAALKKIALANRHSLNDEVVIAIEGHVAGPKDDERCKRCGGFGWSLLHEQTCKPAPKRAKEKR